MVKVIKPKPAATLIITKIKNKKVHILSDDKNLADKGDYKNFMSKEIFEQPITLKNGINEYIDKIKNDINLYNFPIDPKIIKKEKNGVNVLQLPFPLPLLWPLYWVW